MKKKDDILRIEIPVEIHKEVKTRYMPVVRQALEVAAHTLNLESLLLSVYLQGVIDGAEVQRKTRVLNELEEVS